MEKKRYSSYAQIEQDLEILKVEKELYYQRLLQTFDNTKDNLDPKKMFGGIPDVAIDMVSGLAGPLKGMLINFVLKKIFK
ncbi:hypothetical protein HUK80_04305 [Flavobacterium sp. MAH-1]|uniref:Uncharacterized protein n=1 Tax=Flavobacterium agri TaxID=2743471 RepID=A0A7Y8Y0I9_9FLAO|nr:DUF6327 family protein [Flavobacterium agri]NUY80107.1 hypothetical protein [Flavobacterium agri]NYA70132.1 hypothetical protein [Flavobacterium agri]